jgi:hypothetical protein
MNGKITEIEHVSLAGTDLWVICPDQLTQGTVAREVVALVILADRVIVGALDESRETTAVLS